MGSDAAPAAEVAGVLEALGDTDLSVLLVGDEDKIRARLTDLSPDTEKRIEVRHAPEVISMKDAPSIAVKQKKQSSMRICFDLAKAGEVDAVVTAGNSGAAMACGLFVSKRVAGVDRPAIVTTFPTMRGPCALLDMGANVDPKPHVQAQLAVMGAVYARLQHGAQRAKVGLLSNGAEEHKGTALTRQTHKLLSRVGQQQSDFDYVGYVEGRDIFKGNADVVVTDGFTGNALLNAGEGLGEWVSSLARSEIEKAGPLAKLGAMLMRPALRNLKRHTDYAETGGAPLLGVNGVVMICHGGSDPRAIKNAILGAQHFAQSALSREIRSAVEKHAFVWEMADVSAPQEIPS